MNRIHFASIAIATGFTIAADLDSALLAGIVAGCISYGLMEIVFHISNEIRASK